MLKKTLSKKLGLILLFSFAFVVLLGLNLSMGTDAKGTMSPCSFIGSSNSLCPMSATQHISQWELAFTAIPQNHLLATLIILLSFAFAIVIFKGYFSTFEKLFLDWFKRYRLNHPDILLFNYLTFVFARGIVQPKLYA